MIHIQTDIFVNVKHVFIANETQVFNVSRQNNCECECVGVGAPNWDAFSAVELTFI